MNFLRIIGNIHIVNIEYRDDIYFLFILLFRIFGN
jgi:hypothetical protein